MPKSTPMTMDAILDARFMVQPPHQNFGPNLDLLRTEQTTLRLRGVALRRLETALRGGDSVHILSCRIRYQSRGMITRPAPLLDSVVVPGREHFAVRIHNPVNRRQRYPSPPFRYSLVP